MRGLITLVAIVSSAFTSTAMAQSNNNNNEPPSAKKPNQIESVEITEQPKSPGWSKERMQKAKPLPMPKVDPDKAR